MQFKWNMPKTRTGASSVGHASNEEVGHETESSEEEVDEQNQSFSMSSLEDVLDRKLTEHLKDLATKDCIESLKKTVSQQDLRISTLEARIVMLEKYIERIEDRNEENEQYQRRLCLRINGIEMSDDESGEDCLDKVKKVFEDIKAEVPDVAIDRAHRIGKIKRDNNGKPQRQMIVRFTSWRFRTRVYRARKATKKYKIYLDLTKSRLNLINTANDLLGDNGSNKCFAFADVNCRPCLKLEDGFRFFSNEGELKQILDVKENDKEEEMDDPSDE